MKNNTNVRLTVLKSDFEKNQSILSGFSSKETLSKNLIKLTFESVKFGHLGFEGNADEIGMPYDKEWDSGELFSSGLEHFRVMANRDHVFIDASSPKEDVVNLDDAIEAYKKGDMIDFFENAKSESLVMSWREQESILDNMGKTELYLANLTDDEFDATLSGFVETKNVPLVEPYKYRQDAINYLICNDYLAPALVAAEPERYRLFSEGESLLDFDVFQFPRFISEISANIHFNESDFRSLKESMDLGELDIMNILERANHSFEKIKSKLGDLAQSAENRVHHFSINSQSGSKKTSRHCYIEHNKNHGVAIHFDGYGDCCSQDFNGTPVYIEEVDGDIRVVVHSDINIEDPTHIISLHGAKICNRVE